MKPPVLMVLTASGLATARRIAADLPGAEVHGLRGRADDADQSFDETLPELQRLFLAGRPVVGLCAAGVLIRALAPLLGDKRAEPPVVAVAEDGGAVVPLLGGHRGANALARRIGAILGVAPAITTAGDRRLDVALDAPPPGWRLANPQHYKAFAAALLAGVPVRLTGEANWLRRANLHFDDTAEHLLRITEYPASGSANELVYHPQRLALGVGCERDTPPAELIALMRDTLADRGLAAEAVAGVFSLDLKMDEPAVHQLATELGVPARFFTAAELEAETPRLIRPSEIVHRAVGCHGVAEAAALAAAGPDAELIVAKTRSDRATCAVARAPGLIDAGRVGRPRGRLFVVGIGPGSAGWRTPEAEQAVRAASDLVGYSLYLDLLGPLAAGRVRHDYALGEETERVRRALALAATGRSVALVCSGDPGIYAMAALVFERLEHEDRADWRRVEIRIVPGLSALQAAAARAGAPLGHDFCAISLSDLLTPWRVIEQRLRAAAAGDFVVALYNPVSRRRTTQLERAVALLREQRPAATPVVLARNLGREGERVEILRLDELRSNRVDMLTVVLVGSRTSRRTGPWVYTPRGYADKPTRPED